MLRQFEHFPGNVRTHHGQQQSFFALEVAMDEALGTASAGANFPRGCRFISMTGEELSSGQNEGLLSGCPIAPSRRVNRSRCCFGHALHVRLSAFGETTGEQLDSRIGDDAWRRSDFTEVPLNQSATDPPIISESSEEAQPTVLAPGSYKRKFADRPIYARSHNHSLASVVRLLLIIMAL